MLCYAILVAFLICTVTVLLRYVMLYYAILCYVSYMHCYLQTMLCYVMLCYAMLCYTTLCSLYALLPFYYAMLCYAILRRVSYIHYYLPTTLCYIMLCFFYSLSPSYYAMLYYAMFLIFTVTFLLRYVLLKAPSTDYWILVNAADGYTSLIREEAVSQQILADITSYVLKAAVGLFNNFKSRQTV